MANIAGAATTVVFVWPGQASRDWRAGRSRNSLGWNGWLRLRTRFPTVLPDACRSHRRRARERFGRSLWILSAGRGSCSMPPTPSSSARCWAQRRWFHACTASSFSFAASPIAPVARSPAAELRARESPPRVLQAASAVLRPCSSSGAIACGVVVVNYGFVQLWVGGAQWVTGLTLFLLRTCCRTGTSRRVGDFCLGVRTAARADTSQMAPRIDNHPAGRSSGSSALRSLAF